MAQSNDEVSKIEKDKALENWYRIGIDLHHRSMLILYLKNYSNILDRNRYRFVDRNLGPFEIGTSGSEIVDQFIFKNELKWIPYDKFENIEYLDKGGFGTIYKAKFNNIEVIFKYFDYLNNSDESLNEFLNEWKIINSREIIKIFGFTKDPDTLNYVLIMEYANKDSLKSCLTEITKNWEQKLFHLYQIIKGLNDIHEKDLIHYNFHNGNILCSKYEDIYGMFISDYLGLYQLAKSFLKENDIYGVLPFIAPEILRGQPYTQASDIYSFSIIMWEFTSEIPPFNDKAHDLQLALSICKGERPEIIENTPQCYINLMKKCWDQDSLKRPSSKEVLNIIENWIFRPEKKKIEDINEELKSNIMEFINAPIEHNNLIVKSHPKACYTSHLLVFTSDELNEILEDSQGFLKSLKQEYQSSQNEFDYHSTKPKIKWISFSLIKSLNKVAEGGFGIIYKALINGDVVAIKKVLNSQEPNKYFLNELKSLYQCYDSKFEYIIKCHGIAKDPITKEFMFIMKYANGGDLHNYLQKNFAEITWKKKLHILWRISDGLQTIHEKDFVHRDFHSGNILVEIIENDSCKIDQYLIGDLGLSQPANDIPHDSSIYGVIPYIAPEIFKGAKFSKSSDIYCMGMIMWELTTGCKPFANVDHDTELIYKIIDGKRPNITYDTPEDFANLMKKCWNPDPKKRPSAADICEIFNSWSNMGMDAKYFNQAEEIRLELIKLKMLGPDFNEKPRPNAIYTSRSITFNTKPNNKLIEESINNKEYITKEYEFDINEI